jgi:hypothetical protein
MNDKRIFGKDVIALVQHIELNESGWIDAAQVRAVKFLFWIVSAPATIEQLYVQRTDVSLDSLTKEHISSAVRTLEECGEVVSFPDGVFKLTEAATAVVDAAVSQAGGIEADVKKKVLEVATFSGVRSDGKQGDKLWEQFHGEFVVPFIQEFGARAYELITGVSTDAQNTQFISEFLAKFAPEQRNVLEPMILALLDKHDPGCRTYVLRLLNSYFFYSALSLPDDVVKRAFVKQDKQRSLRLILDTNFLFSLFELHSNPSNEAVSLLLKMIGQLPKSLQIKMYVLPTTIGEFRRSLDNYESQAKAIHASGNIVDAGLRANLSGILQSYLKRVKDSGYKITTREYFEPYHDNIRALLDQFGVSILHGEDEKYSTDQKTIDDTLDQLSFYKQKFINDPKRQKSFDQISHDMVLWHFISDRRPEICDTVFDAEWIGVTIDFGLMAFDSFKRHGRGIPSMVHPASLVQVLQMLIPNNINLEQTILALMQMPFLFEPFNPEDEKITRRILGTLSRYEGADELTTDTIIDILGNKALRAKIDRSQNQEEEIVFIKDAIVEHAAELERRIQQAEADLKTSADKFEQQERKNKERIANIEESRDRIESERQLAQEAAATAFREKQELISDIGALKAAEEARKKIDIQRSELQKFLGLFAVLVILDAAFIYVISLRWAELIKLGGTFGPWAAIALVVVASFRLYWLYARSLKALENTVYHRLLGWAARGSWGLLVFVFLAVISPLIYDISKQDIPFLKSFESPAANSVPQK